MNFEIAGIVALSTIFVGYVITTQPEQKCDPVEVIRYVRSPAEMQIKEVEKIVE